MKLSVGRLWPVMLVLFLADCSTKELAEEHLEADGQPVQVVGDLVQLRLTYNTGAAMGISLGPHARSILVFLSVIGIVAVATVYRALPPGNRPQRIALLALMGGAMGNLADRIASAQGVVDFIDIGLGPHRFWTFNLADAAIILGALLFAAALVSGQNPPAGAGSEGAATASSH